MFYLAVADLFCASSSIFTVESDLIMALCERWYLAVPRLGGCAVITWGQHLRDTA
jgi:hypothetical protein